jgi:hypothetical protein
MGELSVTGTPPAALSGQRYAHGMENAVPAAPAEGAAAEPSGPVWRFLIKPRWLGWHLLMVVSFWGMLWLGDWQLHRALAGNGLSWAYTFEWPLFAGFAVGSAESEVGLDDLPVSVRAVQASAASAEDDDDPELSAYNAYLARLNTEVKRHGKWHGWRS